MKPRSVSMKLVKTHPSKDYPRGGFYYIITVAYPDSRVFTEKTIEWSDQDAAHTQALLIQDRVRNLEWTT